MVAADTGGTFTDVAVYDAESRRVSYCKTLTNYIDLAEGALDGLAATGVKLDQTLLFKHGTRHVINTFIQRSGAKTALVATRGFRDTLEIGRGIRPVSFINAYVNPVHEEQAVALLRSLLPDAYVTCGTQLTREWFEYERTSTAAANAYMGERMGSYMTGERLAHLTGVKLNHIPYKGSSQSIEAVAGVENIRP